MQEQRFLFITACLVALIGAPAIYSILHEPQQILTASEHESVLMQDQAERTPASVRVEPPVRHNTIKSKSVVLNYVCKGENQVFEVDGTLVRLKGNSCIDETLKDLSIVNQSNGFTGSVIFLKDKNFTTDFIDLNEGENKLSIQGTDSTGRQVVQSFVVKRRFPASAEAKSN